jgi:hypothetical protein
LLFIGLGAVIEREFSKIQATGRRRQADRFPSFDLQNQTGVFPVPK